LPAFLLLAAAALGWLWWTGKLKAMVFEDWIAAAAFLGGLRLSMTGKVIFGVPLMTGAVLWGMFRIRTRRAASPVIPADEARRLLGIGPDATLAEIRAAHRRLIAKVHPDAGGSTELANRVNAARDSLVTEMNRKTPRAS
jgi:hypothetical protein